MKGSIICLASTLLCSPLATALTVEADFEGASVKVLETRAETQTVRFMPGGDARRGWPCWWYFRVNDLDPSKPLILELQGSDALMVQKGAGFGKPLGAAWAMPQWASISQDGKTWTHTPAGHLKDGHMTYEIKVTGPSLLVAWGPPYTPSRAAAFVHQAATGSANAVEMELCKSREGRSVPMLFISEGDRTPAQRFGIWIEARQHAWESGASWVCQGLAEWILGDDVSAQWLRQNAEVRIVPIMDVDNTFSGNGGKDALPQDHNRDWSDKPHWHEVAAAQKEIAALVASGHMDVFLDLHNPSPGDMKAFFYDAPPELFTPQSRENRDRFVNLAHDEISPVMPMLDKPREAGASYHPLWRQISGNWVLAHGNPHTIAPCLETPWNTERSTVETYKSVGAALARAVQKYLAADKTHR